MYLRHKSRFKKQSLPYPRSFSGLLTWSRPRHIALVALQGPGGSGWTHERGALSVLLHFTSETSACIIKELCIHLEGKGKTIRCYSKGRRMMFIPNLAVQQAVTYDFEEHGLSLSLSPLLTCVLTVSIAFSLSCIASNVQCDTFQYQFKVNRLKVICPTWQEENKHRPDPVHTPKKKKGGGQVTSSSREAILSSFFRCYSLDIIILNYWILTYSVKWNWLAIHIDNLY